MAERDSKSVQRLPTGYLKSRLIIVKKNIALLHLILQLTPPRTARIGGLKCQFSRSGQICLHWAAACLKGHVRFQNEKF